MHHNEDVGQVDEPEGLIKSEAGQHVAMCIVPECSVSKACTWQVQRCCYQHPCHVGFLHHFNFGLGRFDCVLQNSQEEGF